MTESSANPDLVAFHRQSELEASQRAYQEQQDAPAPVTDKLPSATESPASAAIVPAAAPADPAATVQTLRLSVIALIALGALLAYCILRRKQGA